jgi:hypothetical protein
MCSTSSLAVITAHERAADGAQGLLPLFRVQLEGMPGKMFLGLTLVVLAALEPAMWDTWVVTGTGNANYYYAVTLLFGVWQVQVASSSSLLLLLLLLTAALDVDDGDVDVHGDVVCSC